MSDYPHPAALPDEALLEQCKRTHDRAGGPGGQHRNKVETQVTLEHEATGISATAGERRSVRENRSVALKRLRLKLAVEHREPVPAGDIGSELWKSRVKKGGKRPPKPKDPDDRSLESLGVKNLRRAEPDTPTGRLEISPKHRDYPSLLAEAMDAIAAAGWDPKTAAIRLGVTPSQLIKLLKEHPPALARVNEERKGRGQHTLK